VSGHSLFERKVYHDLCHDVCRSYIIDDFCDAEPSALDSPALGATQSWCGAGRASSIWQGEQVPSATSDPDLYNPDCCLPLSALGS
jgi:hypothetical protein